MHTLNLVPVVETKVKPFFSSSHYSPLPQMSRKAVFSGEGFLGSTARISPFDEFEGGLNFRTLQPSGLLFYHNEGVFNTNVHFIILWPTANFC